MWKGSPTSVKHFKIFGRKCYIKRDYEDLTKLDSRKDEGIFLGYSSSNKSYRRYTKILQKNVENINFIIDKAKPQENKQWAKGMECNREEEEE